MLGAPRATNFKYGTRRSTVPRDWKRAELPPPSRESDEVVVQALGCLVVRR